MYIYLSHICIYMIYVWVVSYLFIYIYHIFIYKLYDIIENRLWILYMCFASARCFLSIVIVMLLTMAQTSATTNASRKLLQAKAKSMYCSIHRSFIIFHGSVSPFHFEGVNLAVAETTWHTPSCCRTRSWGQFDQTNWPTPNSNGFRSGLQYRLVCHTFVSQFGRRLLKTSRWRLAALQRCPNMLLSVGDLRFWKWPRKCPTQVEYWICFSMFFNSFPRFQAFQKSFRGCCVDPQSVLLCLWQGGEIWSHPSRNRFCSG